MALLRPFRGLRPTSALVKQVATLPYDVVNAKEARALAKGNARSFFRISRPEVDFPSDVDEHDDVVYRQGKTNLDAFIAQGTLVADASPSLYVYRQRMGRHVQTGVVATASVAEYQQGLIKKHELTRADKEEDRTRHVDALGANDEPVFLTYEARSGLDRLVEEVTAAAPVYDFESDDGIGHTFWVMPKALSAAVVTAFADVPALYIADGHHRSAAAARVAAMRSQEVGAQHFLAVIFPSNQMQILDYNRVVKDLNGRTAEAFLKAVGEKFLVRPSTGPKPTRPHTFGMFLGQVWFELEAKSGTFESTPTGSLDVSILQVNLLTPVLGIGDPRTDKRIDFVGGIRGTSALESRVASGEAAVAFSMFPTQLSELMAIADAGDIMPPKSTWFEPKLRSGLVVHAFAT